eukprot:6472296-Pyramimonas_sp.AAC.1
MKTQAQSRRAAAAGVALVALASSLLPASEEPCGSADAPSSGVLVCDQETGGISHENAGGGQVQTGVSVA